MWSKRFAVNILDSWDGNPTLQTQFGYGIYNKELEISEDRIGELLQPRIHGPSLPVIKKDLDTGGSRL
jgi:hypothetical protein